MKRRDKQIENKLKQLLTNVKSMGLDLSQQVTLLKQLKQLKQFYDETVQEYDNRIKDLESKLTPVNYDWIEELHEAYPQYLSNLINGNKVPARGTKPYTIQQLEEIYCKAIKNVEKRHNQIKGLIDWGIKNKRIIFGFSQFVVNRDWERLELEFLQHSKSVNTIKYGEREL